LRPGGDGNNYAIHDINRPLGAAWASSKFVRNPLLGHGVRS
jgi:hypothetical protein